MLVSHQLFFQLFLQCITCFILALNNNLNPRKRRRNVISYNEDGSENDYDYEDPFINDDSSDDYVPSDSEDEDNDSEHEISQIEI